MINKLIGVMLAMVIGVLLIPTLVTTIDSLDAYTLPAGVQSLVDLLPIIFVVLIVAGAVAYISFKKN